MKRLSLVFFAILLLTALPARAQFNPSPNDPQAPVVIEQFDGSLNDFEKVEIHCYADTSGDYISTSLCTAAENEIRTRAMRRGLSVSTADGAEDARAFTFYVHVSSAGVVPRAVSVWLEVSHYYSAAVDHEAGYREAGAHPRSGKLVMFQDSITGIGQGDSLESAMRVRLRSIIRTFFEKNIRD